MYHKEGLNMEKKYKVVFRGGNGWPVESYYEKKCFAISAALDRGPSEVYEKIDDEWREIF